MFQNTTYLFLLTVTNLISVTSALFPTNQVTARNHSDDVTTDMLMNLANYIDAAIISPRYPHASSVC